MTDRYPPDAQWEEHARNRAPFVETFIPKHGVGAEIGVYCGDFTRYILDIAQPKKLHVIDLWDLLGDSWEHWGIHGPTTAEALTLVRTTYATEIDAGQVDVHVADDLELLPTFDDDYFDWVYIDTSHTYDHCLAELAIVADKVKDGGIIAGDDWTSDPTHPHHGVYLAVNEFVATQPYSLLHGSDTDLQWAITRQ